MPTTPAPKHQISQQIVLEKTALLYRDNIQFMVWSLVLACVFAVVAATVVPWQKVVRWWLLLLIILIIRVFWSLFVLQERKIKIHSFRQLRMAFNVLSVLNALVWGLGTWFFVHELSAELIMLGTLFLVSLCMGAMPFLFYSLTSVISFSIFTMLPLWLWLPLAGNMILTLTALAAFIAILMSYLAAYKLNVFMSRTMRLRIVNAQLNNQLVAVNKTLEKSSATDPLTQIGNRRAFEAEFNKNHSTMYRQDGELAIMMIDVDYFKKINDQHGHLVGDAVLVAIAHTIRDNLKRPVDLAARYGGEEFVVMLPSTQIAGALRVAEVIRQSVADLKLDHLIGSSLHTTVSIGIACLRARESSTELYLSCADKALYDAKESGRNCVRVYNKNQNHKIALVK